MKANIDLTYFVGQMLMIFNDHSQAYLQMKSLTSRMKKAPSHFIRLFIMDILCMDVSRERWFTINDFKKIYQDYSPAMYGKVLKEVRNSQLFNLQEGNPIRFRLKND